ncbi:MAG: type 4a pilus biogenesis protein PilO [Gammaproteobacteria bacterium]|nr:type 4a pilus biogenesis protein PilO [Gammaproteobacteria bacterium]
MAMEDALEQLKNFDINDLDINNIGSWPIAIKIILLVILFGVVLLLGYLFYLTDKQDVVDTRANEETTLRAEYESKRFQAANLDAYRTQRDEMEATFGTLLRQLPSDTEVPGLIEDITRTAIDNDLAIESIALQAERKSEFYIELPINITVEGDYHKIGSFVSGVSNLSRIVTLHDFDIKPVKGPSQLKMSIVARTYRYVEDEA